MNKEHYRVVVYDTSQTPDAPILFLGYPNANAQTLFPTALAINNPNILSVNAAVALGLSFNRRFESSIVGGHTRTEVYGQVFDDTLNGKPAAPATPQYVLTANDLAEQLYASIDTTDIGKRQRISASNRTAVGTGNFDGDVNEDVPQDNG